jgi:hypothetical protein
MNLIESKNNASVNLVERSPRRSSSNPLAPIFQRMMKLLWIVSLFFLTPLSFAQELQDAPGNSSVLLAQVSVPSSGSPQPSATPSPFPSAPIEEGPAASPSLPSVEQLDQMFKQTPLGKAADDARLHAQWRELRNLTANESDLVAARAHAEAATTDLEKRQRLRAYYTAFYDRMRARSSSQELKDFIDARKTEQLALLSQNRVRPGSSPTAGPAATPKGNHKKYGSGSEPPLPQ